MTDGRHTLMLSYSRFGFVFWFRVFLCVLGVVHFSVSALAFVFRVIGLNPSHAALSYILKWQAFPASQNVVKFL